MRNAFRKLKQDGANLLAVEETIRSDVHGSNAAEIQRRQTLLGLEGVGDLEEGGEFGLGTASKDAKPVTKIELSKQKEEEIARMQEYEEEEEPQFEAIQQQEEQAML